MNKKEKRALYNEWAKANPERKKELQKEFIDEFKLAQDAMEKGQDAQYHFRKMAHILAATKKEAAVQ